MIVHLLTLTLHMMASSLKVARPVLRLLNYAVPLPFKQIQRNMAKAINVDSKHLKKGDPLPPYNGTLRIYNMRYCPYAQRTVLILNAKGLEYEVVNVNLIDKPEWLTSKSPFGKVPSIEIKEGVTICESVVSSEYLDEAYPEKPLIAKDPLQRALDKILLEYTNPIQSLMIKVVKFPEKVDEDSIKDFHKAVEDIQDQLLKRGTQYFGGARPGFPDYMIWPWFERLPAMIKLTDGKAKLDELKFKPLLSYIERMRKDPAVSQYLVNEERYVEFFIGYRTGNVVYDF